MLNRRRLLLGGTALATAAAIASVPFAASVLSRSLRGNSKAGDDVIAWLKANTLPLATAEPGSSFDDLEPLRPLLSKARIVSLGETTHGTREFFQLKHRLIEYCVSKLGFTIIALEANYGTTLAVNDYVLHGKGNVADVLAGMGIWCYNTEEVLALVEWVRTWNLTHERKVSFHGFDMQVAGAATLHLLDYLGRVAPDLAATVEANLAPLASPFAHFYYWPRPAQEGVLDQIKSIVNAFGAERAGWTARSSDRDWRLARLSAVTLEQLVRMTRIAETANELEQMTFRDRSMADNVRALLEAEGPDAKAILWAHNAHVKRSPVFDSLVWGRVEWGTMGSFLHAMFGAEHVVVGFSFNQGSFNVIRSGELMDDAVKPAPREFLDGVLAATGIPLFALDLTRVPSDGPVSTWMASRPVQRHIEGNYTPKRERRFSLAADPRDEFDVMIFVESTTAARRMPVIWSARPNEAGPGFNAAPTNLALAGAGAIPDGWRATDCALEHWQQRSPQMAAHMVASSDLGSPAGGATVRIARAGAPLAWGDGALVQQFPAAQWRNQRLVFSAAMRADAPHVGTGARLLVKVSRKSTSPQDQRAAKPLVALQVGGPVRSPEWTRRSVALDIPADAESIQIILVVTGNSAGWFGDLELAATGPARASHREHDFPEMPVRPHHRERLGDLSQWERLLDR